jgi:hypothetical protein
MKLEAIGVCNGEIPIEKDPTNYSILRAIYITCHV